MSKGYETEQAELKIQLAQLSEYIEKSEAKKADTAKFINIVRKYTDLSELTPEIMHEFIEKIVVHAPDKSSGRRKQKIEIHLRFKVAVMDAVLDCKDYDKSAPPVRTGGLLCPCKGRLPAWASKALRK